MPIKRRVNLLTLTSLLSALDSKSVEFDEVYQTEESLEIRKDTFDFKKYVLNYFGVEDKSKFKVPKSYEDKKNSNEKAIRLDLDSLISSLETIEKVTDVNNSYSVFDKSNLQNVTFKSTYGKRLNGLIEFSKSYLEKLESE